MSNEELYEAASDAIGDLFSDRSVSKSITRESLETLVDEIEIMLDSLREDSE